MAIKRDLLDALFSDLVRERNGWICEHCGKDYAYEPINCHAAHIIGRRITRLRHDPRNALCLCATCHHYFTDRPTEWTVFVRKKIGDGVMDELQQLSNKVCKFPRGWKKEARKHYREEAARIKALRMAGDSSYADFVGYW